MTVKVMVFDVQSDSYPNKKLPGQTVNQHKHILQDASDGPRLAQFMEFNTPATDKPFEKGKFYWLDLTQIVNIFGGRPRVVGVLRPLDK